MNSFSFNGRNGLGFLVVVLLVLILSTYVYKSSNGVTHFTSKTDYSSNSGPLALFESPNRDVKDPSQATGHPDMQFLRSYGRVQGLPTAEEIRTLDGKQLLYIYHSYLDNTDYLCHRKLRLGKVGDGGWEVCDDYEFRPLQPCVVYSFGIRNDFSFDDDMGKLYGCDVYSFDPSMNKESHRRSNRVSYYNIGLGGSENISKLPFHTAPRAKKENWRVETLTSIKTMLKHQDTPIDVLKMDIEHSEWPALVDILAKGELTNVRQLLTEYHLYSNNAEYIRRNMPVLSQIEAMGFRRYYTHLNPECGYLKYGFPVARTTCYEVYYVNTRFARQQPA